MYLLCGGRNMILNPIICEGCGSNLQPENIEVQFIGETLIRVCVICGHKVNVSSDTNW